jgi:hypothetical protein
MDQSPKDHRLFHYTSSLDYLLEILRRGFWPRYCVEDFTWMLGHNAYMAFPVVCFCDIPLLAADAHKTRYGRYALAMSKMWAIGRDINPVWYIQATSSVYSHLGHAVQHPVRVTLNTIPPLVKPLLPFLKLTVGDQPDRGGVYPGQNEVLAFEEELEWRHTPQGLMDTWKIGCDREIVSEADHELSKPHRLTVNHQQVDSVFVCAEDERKALIGEFPLLSGKVEVAA